MSKNKLKDKKEVRWFERIERFIGFQVTGLFLCIITFGVATEIVLRKVFSTSLFGLEEFVALSIIIITYMALSIVEKREAHVKMDLLIERLPRKGKDNLEIINLCLALIMFFIITYGTILFTYDSYKAGAISVLRGYPVWPFYMAMPIGAGLMCARLIIKIVISVKEMLK